MKINGDFWLNNARQVPSPYCDNRPVDCEISLLVIHNISLPPSQFGGEHIERFFTGILDTKAHPFFQVIRNMKVSAHCLIRRDGEIVQFVPFHKRAWHAGQSSFAGVDKCNDYSIGIELEGTDFESYTDLQYDALTELALLLMSAYPSIHPHRITGHQYIAPYRKTDPGLVFDWRYFRQCLASRKRKT